MNKAIIWIFIYLFGIVMGFGIGSSLYGDQEDCDCVDEVADSFSTRYFLIDYAIDTYTDSLENIPAESNDYYLIKGKLEAYYEMDWINRYKAKEE